MKEVRINYSYDDVPTVYKFSQSNKLVRGIMGPFGCIAGDTLVMTEDGAIPIENIDQPMRVLSWNDKSNQFELSLSGGAFPKGMDYLYRVSTPQGEFVAAGFHRVLCADGSYQQVENLAAGDSLAACCEDLLASTLGHAPPTSHAGDRRSLRKLAGLMGRYADLARQYGQQLLRVLGDGQEPSPLLTYAQESLCYSYLCGDGHMGGNRGPLLERIRQSRYVFQKRTDGFFPTAERRMGGDRDYILSQSCGRSAELVQQFLLSLRKIAYRCIKKVSCLCYRSFNPLSERAIISIERLPFKQAFWDIQVLDTNNYVTADGTIHHNSGKSAGCSVEIVRRAMEQPPSEDGIRRSKWAVIRNSYRQLEDTSVRTFCDWFPTQHFGDFKQSDMKYTIKALPGVELEILFRALDRPDQVDNLLSLELTGAWVNEAREVPWTIIQALIGRVGRYPKGNLGGWYGIIMDTNPPDNDSWWYKQFEEKQADGWEIFKQPSGISPDAENLSHLPANYYKNLISSMEPELAKVYIHGDYGFVIDGKPVYQEYKDSIHCAEVNPVPKEVIYRGWDFGLTPSCVFTQFVNGKWIVFDEIISESMGADRFSDEVLVYSNVNYPNFKFKDIGDPAGSQRSQTDEKTCFQILYSKGIDIEPGEQTLSARIESVKKALSTLVDGKPCLQMSPKCKQLRKGFQGGYMFKRVRTSEERYKDEPLKNNYSHIHDALQYVGTRLFYQHLITQKDVMPDQKYQKKSSSIFSAWAR